MKPKMLERRVLERPLAIRSPVVLIPMWMPADVKIASCNPDWARQSVSSLGIGLYRHDVQHFVHESRGAMMLAAHGRRIVGESEMIAARH